MVGYLPVIQASASELDKLNTFVKRVLHVDKTVDEALYPMIADTTEVVCGLVQGPAYTLPLNSHSYIHTWIGLIVC